MDYPFDVLKALGCLRAAGSLLVPVYSDIAKAFPGFNESQILAAEDWARKNIGSAGAPDGSSPPVENAPAPDTGPPTLLPDDGSNPPFDVSTRIITENWWHENRMGAVRGARYDDWVNGWQIYSMLGGRWPMHYWVCLPPVRPDAHATENCKNSWEIGWMAAPPPIREGQSQAEIDAQWAEAEARRLKERQQQKRPPVTGDDLNVERG